ncbi:MAG: prolipoprotein diacylglyceryl transferase [Eubacteriales bacterium]|nr:prolipoprotein diacylglyceryl transferase [Eubacteriales bacterium]
MAIRFPNLGLEWNHVGRSFRVFGFEITLCGICIAVGMLLALAFIVLEAKRKGEDQNRYLTMLLISLMTGAVGARLFYAAFSWNLYRDDPLRILDIRAGGMSFYGGLLGGILGAWLYCLIRRLSFWRMADTVSMGLLIAQIIGRWGNLFNRESFGEYTNIVLAMQLPLSSVNTGEVTAAMRENLVTIDGSPFIQVHPVFFYESVWCLLILLLMMVWKRRKRFQGELFLRYLTFYGLGRFFLEWLRSDSLMIPGTVIPVSMVISGALFVGCGIHLAVRCSMEKKRDKRRRQRKEEAYEKEEKVDAWGDGGEEEDISWKELLGEPGEAGVSVEDGIPQKTSGQPDTEPGRSEEKSEAEPEDRPASGAVPGGDVR